MEISRTDLAVKIAVSAATNAGLMAVVGCIVGRRITLMPSPKAAAIYGGTSVLVTNTAMAVAREASEASASESAATKYLVPSTALGALSGATLAQRIGGASFGWKETLVVESIGMAFRLGLRQIVKE